MCQCFWWHICIFFNAQTNAKKSKRVRIPVPSLEEQQSIVKAIEEEMQLVSVNKHIIEIFEQKIKTKIIEVWGVKMSEPAISVME